MQGGVCNPLEKRKQRYKKRTEIRQKAGKEAMS